MTVSTHTIINWTEFSLLILLKRPLDNKGAMSEADDKNVQAQMNIKNVIFLQF